jgi:hypothetical protein
VTGFDTDALAALREARTVRVETSAAAGLPVHETVIWVVVDEVGRVLVRSHRGTRGRWYRELHANPNGALHVAGRRIAVRAEPAADADRVEACSRVLATKYARARGSLASMLRDEILETTLELHPA